MKRTISASAQNQIKNIQKVSINVKMETRVLTQSEMITRVRELQDKIYDLLRTEGFHHVDIKVQ